MSRSNCKLQGEAIEGIPTNKALKQGRVLYGMNLGTPVPAFVEMIGYAGFDYVYIDTEHTTIDLQSLSNMILASEVANIASIVRVADNDDSQIRKILKIGAEGVIVPHVSTREDALMAVQAAKFPPEGTLSHGDMVRSKRFGLPKDDIVNYFKRINEGTTVIVQFEEKEALDHIEEIADVKGVDGILIGLYYTTTYGTLDNLRRKSVLAWGRQETS